MYSCVLLVITFEVITNRGHDACRGCHDGGRGGHDDPPVTDAM